MQPGDSSVGLKEGNVISLEQALYATLLASANEAAYAVAENVGKNAGHDYNWFIQQMNEECKVLAAIIPISSMRTGLMMTIIIHVRAIWL